MTEKLSPFTGGKPDCSNPGAVVDTKKDIALHQRVRLAPFLSSDQALSAKEQGPSPAVRGGVKENRKGLCVCWRILPASEREETSTNGVVAHTRIEPCLMVAERVDFHPSEDTDGE